MTRHHSHGLFATFALTATSAPQAAFNSKRGIDATFEGRCSWAVSPHIHLGVWGSYAMLRRGPQMLGNLEMPRARLDTLGYGVAALWKL